MKTPKFLSKLSAVLSPRPKKKLQATARAARQVMDDYDEEEPTTKLSSAFIVVLILHVVAVGGIYAFNSIKASRRDRDAALRMTEPAAPAASKTVAQNDAPAPAVPANTSAASSLMAPVRKVETPVASPTVTAPKPAVAGGKTYEVKAGDNLTKIAFAYNVSSAEIMAANQLKEGTVLHPGQTITIPAAKTAAKPVVETVKPTATAKDVAPTKTTPGTYTVKKGDTLTSIARSFGLTSEELSKVNKITDPKKLQLGQVLKVPPRKS